MINNKSVCQAKSNIFMYIVIFLLVGANTNLRADTIQNIRKTFFLSPTIGIRSNFQFGTLVPTPQTADVPEVDILFEHKSPAAGLIFGFQFSSRLELQASFSYGSARIMNDVGIGLAGIPLGKSKASDATVYSYTGRIVYYVLDRGFSPYLSAGLGAMTLNTDQFGSKTQLLINFGIGVKVTLSKHFRGFFEVQDRISFLKFDRDFNFTHALIYNPDFKGLQHRIGLSIGVGYVF
ncbi:outer membrane beta-barrel protein [Acidobacteriota bacterium]